MTAKDFVKQLYRIDQLITVAEDNLKDLRAAVTALGSPGFEESYNPNKSTDAPYVRVMEKVVEQEKRLEDLINLKQHVIDTIGKLDNRDERLVLLYRYLYRMSWRDIATEMFMDAKTVMKVHGEGLLHLRYE